MGMNRYAVDKELAGGAVVARHQFEFTTDEPVHEVIATMSFAEATDLPTLAEVLTQFATTITLKQGSRAIIAMSATDLYHMMNLARPNGIAAHQTDGTGADNHVNSIALPIPLGPIGFNTDVNPEFGLDPSKGTIVLELAIPADAALDGRLYTVEFLSVEGKKPTKVIERVTRNLTSGATGDGHYIDLPSGADVELYDVAMFQTTALTAGSTSDLVGIDSFSLEINQTEGKLVDVYTRGIQSNLGNLSQAASSPKVSATYIYMNLNEPHKADMSIPLPQKARINLNMEVAEAMRFFGGIIRKL